MIALKFKVSACESLAEKRFGLVAAGPGRLKVNGFRALNADKPGENNIHVQDADLRIQAAPATYARKDN